MNDGRKKLCLLYNSERKISGSIQGLAYYSKPLYRDELVTLKNFIFPLSSPFRFEGETTTTALNMLNLTHISTVHDAA